MWTSLRVAASLTVVFAASPSGRKAKSAPAPVRPAASAETVQAELNAAFIRRDESAAPLVAVWVSPTMIGHALATNAKAPPRDGAIADRFLSRVMVFAIQKPEGVTEAELRDHARMRDASGGLASPVFLPAAFQEQFGSSKDAVAVAFLAPSEGKPNTGGTIELVLQDLGGVPERTYRWPRTQRFSPAVAKTLAAERANRAARIRTVAIKPAELTESTTAWLSDFLYAEGKWYIVSWLPRELLVAGMSHSPAGKAGAEATTKSLKNTTPLAIAAMDPDVKREDLARFSTRLRLVDPAGNQFPDTPTKDELLTVLGNTIAGNGQLTMRLLLFPTAIDLTGANGPRIALLDDQQKEVASIGWKRPEALPVALSRYLKPAASKAARPAK